MKYYIHDGKQQKGPFSEEEIKAMNISPNTMVWYDGLTDWTEAKNVFQFAPTPPPLKKIPPELKKEEQKKSNPFLLVGKIASVLALIFVVLKIMPAIYYHLTGDSVSTYTQPTQSEQKSYYPSYDPNEIIIENKVQDALKKKEEEDKKQEEDKKRRYYQQNIIKFLNPHTNDFKRDPIFGNVWDVQVKIDNTSPYKLNKVLVRVNYLGIDRKSINAEFITFYDLKPGVRQILEASGCKGAYDIECEVHRVECDDFY